MLTASTPINTTLPVDRLYRRRGNLEEGETAIDVARSFAAENRVVSIDTADFYRRSTRTQSIATDRAASRSLFIAANVFDYSYHGVQRLSVQLRKILFADLSEFCG